MLLHQSQLLTAPPAPPPPCTARPCPPGRSGPTPALLPLPGWEAAPLHAAQGSLHSQACGRPGVLRAQPGTASPRTLCGGRPPRPCMRAAHRPDSAPVRRVFRNQPTCKSFQPNSGQWRPQLPKPLHHICAPFKRPGHRPGPADAAPRLVRTPSFLGLFLRVTRGPDLNVPTAQNRKHVRQRRGNRVSKDGSPGLTVQRDIGSCCPGRWGHPLPGPTRPGPLPPDTESTVEGTVCPGP